MLDKKLILEIDETEGVKIQIGKDFNFVELLGLANFLEYYTRLRCVPSFRLMDKLNEEERKEKECKQTKQ